MERELVVPDLATRTSDHRETPSDLWKLGLGARDGRMGGKRVCTTKIGRTEGQSTGP